MKDENMFTTQDAAPIAADPVTHAKQQAVFDKVNELNLVLASEGGISVPANTVLAQLAGRLLAIIAAEDMPEEAFADVLIEAGRDTGGQNDPLAQVIGHFTLQAFGDGTGWNAVTKKRLVEIADVLGPDNLDSLRKYVAFMIKVEGFE